MHDLKEALKTTMSEYPSGVVVVTTIDEHGHKLGFTATSFSSLSMDPPSVFVCLANTARSYNAFLASHHFAVNFIDADDSAVAVQFARRGEDKFAGVEETRTQRGVPVLANAVAFIECETDGHFVSGDHAILVGKVLRARVDRKGDVLVHYRRQFGRVTLPVNRQAELIADVLGYDWFT